MELLRQLSPSVLATVGIALAAFILLARSHQLRKRMDHASKEELTDRKSLTSSQTGERPVEILRWQVEMHELSRDMKAELDSKMRSLQILIAHANEAATRLERAIERSSTRDESN